jgi:uncharacterized protein YwqG
MNRDELELLASRFGLATHASKLAAAAADCIRLHSEPTEEHRLPRGASRLGGVPDFAPVQEWPSWSKGPLSLVAQLNLEDLRAFPIASALPATGWLSFFYNADQETWGFDPRDIGSFKIVYTPPGPVERRIPPSGLPEHGLFQPAALRFEADLTLPSENTPDYPASGLAGLEREAYGELLDHLATEHGWEQRSHLFGYAQEVQGTMEVECALVTGGVYCGDASGYHDPRATKLKETARDWRLLLQLASEENSGMMWGDLGFLYYWMRKQDLATHDFSKGWLILQCA